MATGSPGGLEIAKNLLPKAWIGAHDEAKKSAGIATRKIWRKEFDLEEIRKKLWGEMEAAAPRLGTRTEVVKLESGKEFRVDGGMEKVQRAPTAPSP